MSLLYPKWIPGEHGPTGPIDDLAGIRMKANGQTVPWRRDDVNVYELHVDVPQGVSTLDVSIDFISPPETGGFSSGGSTTSQLAFLSWNQLLLYPKGTPTDQLQYQANLKIPRRLALRNCVADRPRVGEFDHIQALVAHHPHRLTGTGRHEL